MMLIMHEVMECGLIVIGSVLLVCILVPWFILPTAVLGMVLYRHDNLSYYFLFFWISCILLLCSEVLS